ncbi:MAG: OmpA family protein [Neomegalonema sp.]|nr:OmpA family protein [Neomegalonema sp.]
MADGPAPIIKKVKKVSGGGHHGGAWKVAYADFVTAMMAFFLLMWLLSSTSEDQRKGIADFFSPSIPISKESSGGRSMFKGEVIFSSKSSLSSGVGGRKKGKDKSDDDAKKPEPGGKSAGDAAKIETKDAPKKDPAKDVEMAKKAAELAKDVAKALDEEKAAKAMGKDRAPYATKPPKPEDIKKLDDKTLEAAAKERRERQIKAVEAAFEALKEANKGDALLDHLTMKITPEGLMIEISEVDGRPLFTTGSAEPTETLRALIEVIAPLIGQVQNDLSLVGHTDARPYRPGSGYSNWRLSADRADAARRILLEQGLPETRIRRISGAAAREPLSKDPFAPENRRIGITLLRETASRSPAATE